MSKKFLSTFTFATYYISINIKLLFSLFYIFCTGQVKRKSASLNNVGHKYVTNLILNCNRLYTSLRFLSELQI